jgi:hypothetical protein
MRISSVVWKEWSRLRARVVTTRVMNVWLLRLVHLDLSRRADAVTALIAEVAISGE